MHGFTFAQITQHIGMLATGAKGAASAWPMLGNREQMGGERDTAAERH
jgi:hypothetical protein